MRMLLLSLATSLSTTAIADTAEDMKVWSMLFFTDPTPILSELAVSEEHQLAFVDYAKQSRAEVREISKQGFKLVCDSESNAESVAEHLSQSYELVNSKIREQVAGIARLFSPTELSAIQGKAAEAQSTETTQFNSVEMIRDGRVDYRGVIERSCGRAAE